MESKTVVEEKKITWWGNQIPNILTVIRIILVPVFICLFIVATSGYEYAQLGNYYYYQLAALIVFCVAAYTDYLDGLLARRWNLISNFGKLVDPIADKTLMMSSFILLSWYFWLYWWFTFLVIFRELAVTLMRFLLLRGGKVLPASQGGKLKTLLQCLLVFLLLLQPLIESDSYIFHYIWVEVFVLVAAFVVTMVSGFAYFLDSWLDLRDIFRQGLRSDVLKATGESMSVTTRESEPEAEVDLQGESVSEPQLEELNPVESVRYIAEDEESIPLSLLEDGTETELEEDNNLEVDKNESEIILSAPLWKPLHADAVTNNELGISDEDDVVAGLKQEESPSRSVLETDLVGEDIDLPDLEKDVTPPAGMKYPPRRKRLR